jgi:hypothetical protein
LIVFIQPVDVLWVVAIEIDFDLGGNEAAGIMKTACTMDIR